MTIKEFLLLDENKKAYWTAGNWLMALAISYITYQAGAGLQWAVTILPIARVLSEMITRYFNDAYAVKFGKNANK
jgi:hypothetical protein